MMIVAMRPFTCPAIPRWGVLWLGWILFSQLWHPIQAQNSLQPGFTIVKAWEKLAHPTGVRFARDGRVFVIGKGGVIYTAKNVRDRNMKMAIDISNIVFSNFDKVSQLDFF
jgi:hypothetical protein